MAETRQAGLRLQIVLALAGLMLLAFVPLFFAVASLTRATIVGAREQAALALGRAVATDVMDARDHGTGGSVERLLRAHSARFVDLGGQAESAHVVQGESGREVEVLTPMGDQALVMRVPLGDAGDRGAALVRLVALYMITFALALLVFAYFALTRLIVRPTEQLVAAADRVASGARTLRVPKGGARELGDLASSVQTMAEKLISEEAKLLLKVEELTQTQAQLVRSERMASVGRLAAGVAHEIGNPIAAIMGMHELLEDPELALDTQRDFLRRMRKETERIHGVLRDLLDFARPEEKEQPGSAPPAPADVRAVISDVVALAKPQKAFRETRIETDIEGSPHVQLGAQKLTQVLLNLVLNAGSAMASAEKKRDGVVTVRARVHGDRVRIEVQDDGPGIDPKVRGRLFEPFVTTKEVGEGTGLGLAVCRGLVESAGGDIGVDATYTGGARFYVVLPAS
ncbi:MAG TPA: HAMP domain-containing sensor histidine kinase [Polyangiaceae bacterium]